ncbi:flagellar biosynthesis protein FlaG [Paenibacillus sp. LMG 31460]|uniref:Flagellar biosynthesis protein FlaG n=2 Tax=Paenibacillus germinis TaxID=2654979 RepID=A0ABX1ZD16_9BACL|nr:flagellar biosynthesis protein FlaG [Paenibacillus germinis]
MNYSIGGSGGQSSPDRSANDPMAMAKPLNNESTPVLNINNSYELKQAELKGENVTISDTQVVKAIEHAIKAVQGKNTSLEFSIHQTTKLISVKVLDKDTGEIIREIPPEKSLDFVAKLWEMAGIFVDERR